LDLEAPKKSRSYVRCDAGVGYDTCRRSLVGGWGWGHRALQLWATFWNEKGAEQVARANGLIGPSSLNLDLLNDEVAGGKFIVVSGPWLIYDVWVTWH